MDKKLSKELQDALIDIFRQAINENMSLRKLGVKEWKKNEEYWRGVQYLFWSEANNDWQLPPDEYLDELPKVANYVKAHGESIIAALSSALPRTLFSPKDADSSDDITTAKVYSLAAKNLQKQNKADLLFIRSLYILYNQCFVAGYNYSIADEKFGVVTEPEEIVNEERPKTLLRCADCGADVTPGEEEPGDACHACGSNSAPIESQETEEVPVVKKFKNIPKHKEFMDVFGPLHIKIPYFARSQADCGYLIFSTEEHYAKINEDYFLDDPDHWLDAGTFDMISYDRWARQTTSYDSETSNMVTIHRCWFRPWQFNVLGKAKLDLIKQLKEEFTNGCKVIFVTPTGLNSEIFCEAVDEPLDDHWSISVNPTSPHLHAVPMVTGFLPIQDMKNELLNLTLQTVEHGIPQTFVNPAVVDIDAYEKNEAQPGAIYPTRPISGNIGEGFYTTTTAQLTKEVGVFSSELDQVGQFVLGDFPSVFGGPSEGSTRTLGEYSQSRNNALQRLSIAWKFINNWWPDFVYKASKEYLDNLKEDENMVERQGDTFTNLWIRMSDKVGNVGLVESETGDLFPISLNQKQDLLFKLIGLQIPQVLETLFSPDNAQFIASAFGFPEINLPIQDQRNKQYREIRDMIQGQQVPIEPDVDDDNDHISVCTAFLIGETGQQLKLANPDVYMLILMHLKEHKMNAQAAMMQQMMSMNPQGGTQNVSGPVYPQEGQE